MTYNTDKLGAELMAAGCRAVGWNSDGRVDYAPEADATDRVKAAAILAAHDPSPTREQRLAARGLTPLQAALLLVVRKGLAAPAWARALVAAGGDKLAAEEGA